MSIETTTPFLRGLEERRGRVERFLVAAHRLRTMSLEQRIEVVEDVIAFLTEMLLPQADAFDGDEIRQRIAELTDCEPRRTGRMQELLYALYVLASTHLQKEEEAYLRRVAAPVGA